MVEYAHLQQVELGHQSQSVCQLEEEAWADVVGEGVGVLEVFWMGIIVTEDVGAVVVVFLTVFVSILVR